MNSGPPLGRAGPAGGRRAAPTTLAPELPAPPRDKPRHKRWCRFVRRFCLSCTSAAQSEDKEQGAETPRNKEQEHEGEKEAKKRAHPPSDPSPHFSRRRCDLKILVQKLLVHERLHRNAKMKVREKEEEEKEVVVAVEEGEAMKEETVQEEEEETKQGGQTWLLNPCNPLSFCCLFAFLLLVAVYAITFHTFEDPRQRPTQTQLWKDMVVVAVLVMTAAWSLYAFPSPATSTSYEAMLLVLLTLTNAFLVLLARAVLAVVTPLGYCCCCWLLGIIGPFFLLVLISSVSVMRGR